MISFMGELSYDSKSEHLILLGETKGKKAGRQGGRCECMNERRRQGAVQVTEGLFRWLLSSSLCS